MAKKIRHLVLCNAHKSYVLIKFVIKMYFVHFEKIFYLLCLAGYFFHPNVGWLLGQGFDPPPRGGHQGDGNSLKVPGRRKVIVVNAFFGCSPRSLFGS